MQNAVKPHDAVTYYCIILQNSFSYGHFVSAGFSAADRHALNINFKTCVCMTLPESDGETQATLHRVRVEKSSTDSLIA